MAKGKLSSKFQISIPKEVREQMHLESGQVFFIIPRGSTIQLVPKRSIDEFKGALAGANVENVRDRKDRT
jgi:AbrB family looped-hinge helix DNA binding protein